MPDELELHGWDGFGGLNENHMLEALSHEKLEVESRSLSKHGLWIVGQVQGSAQNHLIHEFNVVESWVGIWVSAQDLVTVDSDLSPGALQGVQQEQEERM